MPREDLFSQLNAKTFVAAAKWLKQIMTDERLHNWLSEHEIKRQFNVSRAPWWGGQFERMVSLVKQALYKCWQQPSHLERNTRCAAGRRSRPQQSTPELRRGRRTAANTDA